MLAVFFLSVRTAGSCTNSSFSVSLVDEARRWFESSTVICRYVPDGPARAAKVGFSPFAITIHFWIPDFAQISETYTQLLSKFLPGTDKLTKSGN